MSGFFGELIGRAAEARRYAARCSGLWRTIRVVFDHYRFNSFQPLGSTESNIQRPRSEACFDLPGTCGLLSR